MAKPKVHAYSMFVFALLLLLLGISTDILSFVINLIILFLFGAVIPDLDHINFKDPIGWAIKFVKHEKVALPKGTKLWLHTFSGLIAVVVVSILFMLYFPTLFPFVSYYLPVLAFIIHMIIDGANDAYDVDWRRKAAPLPWIIHNKKFYPSWIEYSYVEEETEDKGGI